MAPLRCSSCGGELHVACRKCGADGGQLLDDGSPPPQASPVSTAERFRFNGEDFDSLAKLEEHIRRKFPEEAEAIVADLRKSLGNRPAAAAAAPSTVPAAPPARPAVIETSSGGLSLAELPRTLALVAAGAALGWLLRR